MARHRGLVSGLQQGARIAAAVWRHPANQRRRFRGLASFLGWQVFKSLVGRPVVIAFHGRRLKCYPDSTSTTAAIYFCGFADYWEMKFMQAYLRPGDGFLDIGANTGVYSVLASGYVGTEARIDAFEPMEATASRIEEQAALNKLHNLRVHRLAVCDRDGELDFGYAENDAMMHLRREGEPGQPHAVVSAIRLDSFEPYGNYMMGKMDIEGAEPFALAGAAARLRAGNPPVWLIELAGLSTLYGVTTEAVVGTLDEAGYDCCVFNPEAGCIEYTRTPWQLGVQNVLAISRRHTAVLKERLEHRAASHL
jgi:FkbM family methyltransferase